MTKKILYNFSLLMFLFIFVISILFFCRGEALCSPQSPKIIHENFDFQFRGRIVRGDSARPEALKIYPGILVLSGDIEKFAREGFFAVSIQFEDELDCKQAIEKMIRHRYCKSRVGVTGFSFAGALSMVVAARNPNVGAVVEISGLLHPNNRIDLSKDMPAAILFISGERDDLVTPQATKQMYDALRRGGKPAEMYIVPGQGHGFSPEYNEIVFRKSVEFFRKHLGK